MENQQTTKTNNYKDNWTTEELLDLEVVHSKRLTVAVMIFILLLIWNIYKAIEFGEMNFWSAVVSEVDFLGVLALLYALWAFTWNLPPRVKHWLSNNIFVK